MKYELEEDFSIETSVEFGRLYKKNGQWKFKPSVLDTNKVYKNSSINTTKSI